MLLVVRVFCFVGSPRSNGGGGMDVYLVARIL